MSQTKNKTQTQADVARWFDTIYATEGLDYLRPFDAYPIYLQLLGAGREERSLDRLLDVGCGPGLLLRAGLDRGLATTGIDISERAVAIARDYVPAADVRVGNAETMPFPDGAFDLVTCIGALERFFDRTAALAEIRRVTGPGARFCFMVRNARGLGWRLWRQWLGRQNHAGHQDARGLEEWRELFETNGFVIEDILMDQWMRQKLRRVMRGFRPHDFRKPEPVARPLFSMRFVYEYIFLLKKRDGTT